MIKTIYDLCKTLGRPLRPFGTFGSNNISAYKDTDK